MEISNSTSTTVSDIFNSTFEEDFSHFAPEDNDKFLHSCEHYIIDDFTETTLSYVIRFKNSDIYQIFQDIIHQNYSRDLFEDRGPNGLVYSFIFQEQKVVLHIHASTLAFHIQAKGCSLWFKEAFSTIAKQLHDEIKYSESNTSSDNLYTTTDVDSTLTLPPTDMLDESQTNPKLFISGLCNSSTPIRSHGESVDNISNTNPKVLESSTLSSITITDDTRALKEEIANLKEMVINLSEIVDQLTKSENNSKENKASVDCGTQTDGKVLISRHSETPKQNISTQIYKEISDETIKTQTHDPNPETISKKDKPKVETPPKQSSPTSNARPIPSLAPSNRAEKNRSKPTVLKNVRSKNNLIIGSSLLKGIQTRGLTDTAVCTNRGATIQNLIDIINNNDVSHIKNIIIHIGGNDLSNGDNLDSIVQNYEELLRLLRSVCDKETVLMVSGIPPRYNMDTYQLNEVLHRMCQDLNIQFIDHDEWFHDDQGYVKTYLYGRDGIHLSKKGTSALLKSINQYVSIIKFRNDDQFFCSFCGEYGHNSRKCRYGEKLQCFNCKQYGHKEYFCSLYH